jgi:hypothetical protein
MMRNIYNYYIKYYIGDILSDNGKLLKQAAKIKDVNIHTSMYLTVPHNGITIIQLMTVSKAVSTTNSKCAMQILLHDYL